MASPIMAAALTMHGGKLNRECEEKPQRKWRGKDGGGGSTPLPIRHTSSAIWKERESALAMALALAGIGLPGISLGR